MKPTSGSEFDDFLYATVLEESNGALLTVLSALARANLDPWDEAARLARLPCEIAATNLVKLIVALPAGLAEGLDAGALARQLISRLPRQDAARAQPAPAAPASSGGFAVDRSTVATLLWIYLLLTLAFLGAQWLGGPIQMPLRPNTDASPTNGPASSPPQTSLPVVGSPFRA